MLNLIEIMDIELHCSESNADVECHPNKQTFKWKVTVNRPRPTLESALQSVRQSEVQYIKFYFVVASLLMIGQ